MGFNITVAKWDWNGIKNEAPWNGMEAMITITKNVIVLGAENKWAVEWNEVCKC